MTDRKRLYLIDGHALIFRMYYAFLRHPMINSKGMDMSILFGFTKYILELLEKQKPEYFAVAFDPPGGTFRNKMFPEYKANRPPTPPLIIDALEPLKEICGALNIPVLMMPGYEADDVIGTIAKKCAAEGLDVYMVTPDKDYGQLIADHIFQVKPGKSGGDDEVYGKAEVCEKYKISDPSEVIEMLAICGDTADNVPGVKGVGEVGAAKLIAKYGTVENIYAHIDELTPKQKLMFEEARDHMKLSHDLVTIKTDVPVEAEISSMAVDKAYGPLIADLFTKYEFGSLRRYISHVKADAPSADDNAVSVETEAVTAEKVADAAKKEGRVALVVSEEVTLVASENGKLISAAGPAGLFKAILEDKSVAKAGHSLKAQVNRLCEEGICLGGTLLDVELMHYLVDPEKSHEIDVLAASYLGATMDAAEQEGDLFAEPVSNDDKKAAAALLLVDKLREEMKERGVSDVYDTIEEPLVRVLAKMERDGVKIDLASLNDFAEGLRREVAEREARIREMAGEPDLNVSSPKQIGVVLFEKLQLDPKAKKGAKGAWSTDEQTLVELSDRHPIVDEILEFRGVKKLLSTYIEPFPSYVNPKTGRVHTTFNQALTSTGRLSSSNPNLQNIPIRTERGKEIRKAFVPGTEGGLIMSADYSQIELRIMAHLSCDAHLIAAFKDGVDVHAATASKIFGIPVGEVTSDQRRIAKTANFGIMYGISSFGLAQRLHVSRTDAKKIIDDYFAAFPAISSFIADTIEGARENGYVETLFGRRRYIRDINAKNGNLRQLAERNAVNAPIQGTSADIIKIAMVRVADRMEKAGLKSKMVLQIHDELVFDTLADEVEVLKNIVVEEMEHVLELSIPLTVECNYGTNWLEAH
ncbi:MAG: DNA polymerase I [Bacteroidales bacterium]|nr:DNA polymerase I [Bacteroidales bacterium]